MRLALSLIAILFFLPTSEVPAQRTKVKVTIFQEGRKVRPSKGVYELEQKPFSIRLKVKNAEDVFLHTSVQSGYYDLGAEGAVPDFQHISFKSYAENPNNRDKRLYVGPDGFSWLGYDSEDKSHKFNILEPTRKGYEGWRIVQHFFYVESKDEIPVEEMTDDLFLFLIATKGHSETNDREELYRDRFRIVWK